MFLILKLVQSTRLILEFLLVMLILVFFLKDSLKTNFKLLSL